MHVHVDEAGDDERVGGVDNLRAGRRDRPRFDRRDLPSLRMTEPPF
jgi:hypothetical protein